MISAVFQSREQTRILSKAAVKLNIYRQTAQITFGKIIQNAEVLEIFKKLLKICKR